MRVSQKFVKQEIAKFFHGCMIADDPGQAIQGGL
jgi:hypothetical protein